jgi:hypothetical protein
LGQVVLVVEAALAAAEDRTLEAALVALAVLLEALGLLALAALPDGLRLHSEAEPLGLGEVLAVLVDEAVDVPGERIDDCLLVLLLVGGVVAAGVAVAGLRAEELFLEALAVEFEAAGAFAVAAYFLIGDGHLLGLLLIY